MSKKESVENFISISKLAVVGVSSSGKKFGNTIFKELKKKGYEVYPINPAADKINGEVCYKDIDSLPEKVEGVITVVPPAATEKIVEDANIAGINSIWMQQGSESEKAINYCNENGIDVIHGECILMFAEPVESIHKFHKWLWKIFGKLPK
ncbi:MAG: CoA-binding protein [Ignavibacteriae bacterium]|nr:CoA-binding protein [Ignavibacteriota bacterium]NOG97285.1 CoA-binding protein [Ignavibacteriota bacterium]